METQNQNPINQNRQQKQTNQSQDQHQDQNKDGQPNGAIPDSKPRRQTPNEDQEIDGSNREAGRDEEKNPNDLSDPDNPGSPLSGGSGN